MMTEQVSDSDPQDNGLSSLSNLGSLAQSAREKQLKVARNILIGIGIVVLLLNIFRITNTKNETEQVVQEQIKVLHAQGMQADQTSVEEFRTRVSRICYLIYGSFAFLGVVYVILGLLVRAFPVPATVLGLVLYIGSTAILGFINPILLLTGWFWKILIVVGMAKSIQAAVAYQKG